MLILLEGPDGAGKTTLAEKLVNFINSPQVIGSAILHHRGPPSEPTLLEEYLLPLAGYVPGTGDHVVCDRWHLGELVYPGLLQRSSLADDRLQLQYLQLFLASRGALVIHVDATYDTLLGRLMDRPSTLDYEFQIATQRDRFRHAAHSASAVLPVATVTSYPTGRTTVQLPGDPIDVPADAATDQVVERLVGFALEAERDVVRLANHPTYVGSPRPVYLLLGDVRGGEQQFPTAFAPNGPHSARYLLESLPPGWLGTTILGIANANEDDDLRHLWETIGQPRTLTFGTNARAAVRAIGVRAGSVPHPQFIKRFHHRRQKAYGEVIQKTMLSGEDKITWRP